jgi:hypothetical protein
MRTRVSLMSLLLAVGDMAGEKARLGCIFDWLEVVAVFLNGVAGISSTTTAISDYLFLVCTYWTPLQLDLRR